MKKMSQTVIFFGSGPVAKASLDFLAKHFDIETIITKPVTVQEMSMTVPEAPIYGVQDAQALDKLFGTSKFTSQVAIIVDFGVIVS